MLQNVVFIINKFFFPPVVFAPFLSCSEILRQTAFFYSPVRSQMTAEFPHLPCVSLHCYCFVMEIFFPPSFPHSPLAFPKFFCLACTMQQYWKPGHSLMLNPWPLSPFPAFVVCFLLLLLLVSVYGLERVKRKKDFPGSSCFIQV